MEEFNIIKELIGMVKEVSPLVWEATRRQVYAQAISLIVWAAVFAGVSFSFGRFSKFSWDTQEKIVKNNVGKEYLNQDEGYSGWIVIASLSAIGAFISLMFVIDCVSKIIQMLYAPDYHTIKMLLETVR